MEPNGRSLGTLPLEGRHFLEVLVNSLENLFNKNKTGSSLLVPISCLTCGSCHYDATCHNVIQGAEGITRAGAILFETSASKTVSKALFFIKYSASSV